MINVTKMKALISCRVTAQQICAFVFAYVKSRFLAHLSQRLKGELIVYQSSCRLCVCLCVCKHFQI